MNHEHKYTGVDSEFGPEIFVFDENMIHAWVKPLKILNLSYFLVKRCGKAVTMETKNFYFFGAITSQNSLLIKLKNSFDHIRR